MSDPSRQPVFVVGGPRTGTTLLAAMLSAHSRFDCGPETHCYSRWSNTPRLDRRRVLDPAAWPGPATDYVCSLALGKRPVHELYGLSREEVRAWLAARPPTLAALLEALTAQRAERHGKARWVEKTPRHLGAVRLVRRAFPEAPVIHILRDPRDAAVSLTQVPFGAESMVTNITFLAREYEASAAFFRTDPRALTLRYEDLVADPEAQLARLCAFVGEAFEPGMVAREEGAGGVAAAHEWWKEGATAPLDPARSGRWRTAMPAEVARFACLHLAGFLEEHGYEGARPARHQVALVPCGDALPARHDDVLVALAAADAVVLRPVPRHLAELARQPRLVLFGQAGQLDPDPGAPPLRHGLALLGLAALLGWRRLLGRPVPWVRRYTLRRRRSAAPGERVTAALLRLLARRVEPAALPRVLGLATTSGAAASPRQPEPEGHP